MTDEHETLTAEYERLVKALEGLDHGSSAAMILVATLDAARHILYRLGPPDAMADADAATQRLCDDA